MYYKNSEMGIKFYPSVYCLKDEIKTCVGEDGKRKYLLKDLQNVDGDVICEESFMKTILPATRIMPFGMKHEDWMSKRIGELMKGLKSIPQGMNDYVEVLKFMDVNHLEFVSTGCEMLSEENYAIIGVVRWRHDEVGEDAALFVATHGDIGDLEVHYEYICTVDGKVVFSPRLRVKGELAQ